MPEDISGLFQPPEGFDVPLIYSTPMEAPPGDLMTTIQELKQRIEELEARDA